MQTNPKYIGIFLETEIFLNNFDCFGN